MLDTICFSAKKNLRLIAPIHNIIKSKKEKINTIYVKVAIIHFNKKRLIKLE
ncbi:hypothetical protein GCM10007971_12410 [Oceanobacillus indicireducens]|uniref:Uncharacterized protein n=1 Tax=Oceanobacillus indicireducens TaxID=1004261 RepID=A0A917XWG2_9BACI|nr:hypothetical protein GCM10007971_12410 [Oceanobacillus indicireducens]